MTAWVTRIDELPALRPAVEDPGDAADGLVVVDNSREKPCAGG